MEEAQNLNHNYVGTEHLLLGLLRNQDSVAGHVLTSLGLAVETVRSEVPSVLGSAAEGGKWTQRGAGPLRPMIRIAESRSTSQVARRDELGRDAYQHVRAKNERRRILFVLDVPARGNCRPFAWA